MRKGSLIMYFSRFLSFAVFAVVICGRNPTAGYGNGGWTVKSPDTFYYPRNQFTPPRQNINFLGKSGKSLPDPQPSHSRKFKELTNVFEARNLEFSFPTDAERNRVIQAGLYVPEVPLPIDVSVYYSQSTGKPTIFMTIPRFGDGVPYSLAIVTDVQRPNGPELRAYPSYDWHSSHGRDCNGLTSVYRVEMDPCGQMWIIDSGEVNINQLCPPQIVVINIKSAQLAYRYRLPENIFKTNQSRFVNLAMDFRDPPPSGECREAFVYMADPLGQGLVVLDVVRARSWRIENKYTFPDPGFSTHTIDGVSFELLDGIFGLSITPRGLGLERSLYFHSLSHDMQVAVPLAALNNETLWPLRNVTAGLKHFVALGRRGVQCAASAMTPHGFLLCGLLEPIGIMSWNIRTPYTSENLVLLAENRHTLQFVSGLKVIQNPQGRYDVWMLSNRLQKAFTGTTNFTEINYRIQRCGVDEMILGTACRSENW